jgi:hypothetical protein
MRRMQRIVLLVGLIAIAPALAGCESFDPDKFDFFGLNEKKKLPGDRKQVFPEGVPGVSQGIPPEFVKGNQPPPDSPNTAQALPAEPAKQTAAVESAEEPKPKPKRKKPHSTAAAPKQPAMQNQSGGQAQPPAWPTQDQQQPPQQSSTAPWPSSPAPGTFQR